MRKRKVVEPPLVSVCLITYNHVKYIRQAIDSVLIQKLNFSWELIIADDYSTDGTREIILEYKKNHPDLITLIFQEANVGPAKNWFALLTKPNGRYIAYLEGDDFWIDPFKLQKQVEFLEANSNFVFCYHPVMILMPNGDYVGDFIAEKYFQAPESTIYDLAIFGNYIHSPSVIFRTADLSITGNLLLSPVGDYFLYLLLAQKGKIKRLEFLGAVYRNGNGSFSSLDFQVRKYHRQKTLSLASSDISNFLVSIILKLRIHHNSFLGKLNHVILEPSGVKGLFTFLMFVKKLELLKAIVKILFYKRIKS